MSDRAYTWLVIFSMTCFLAVAAHAIWYRMPDAIAFLMEVPQ